MKTLINKFFPKKEEITNISVEVLEQPTVAPKTKEYPKIVQEIHREFDIAGDKLIEEANIILGNTPKINESKVDLLKSLGFTQTKELVKAEEVKRQVEFTQQQLEAVNYYRREYPFNKFITEEQVQTICKKYGLVCGDVSKYQGFVPEKNLKEIANFKLKEKDARYYRTHHGIYGSHTYNITYEKYLEHSNSIPQGMYIPRHEESYHNSIGQYKICAPLKDMDTRGMNITDGYKLEHVPDPIVLQSVQHGYLIISKWADETFDPSTEEILRNDSIDN